MSPHGKAFGDTRRFLDTLRIATAFAVGEEELRRNRIPVSLADFRQLSNTSRHVRMASSGGSHQALIGADPLMTPPAVHFDDRGAAWMVEIPNIVRGGSVFLGVTSGLLGVLHKAIETAKGWKEPKQGQFLIILAKTMDPECLGRWPINSLLEKGVIKRMEDYVPAVDAVHRAARRLAPVVGPFLPERKASPVFGVPPVR
jgi:hypothetical protein